MNEKPFDIGGLFSCKRIVVVGANGAGKTFFANRIADHLQRPVIHNDALALAANWRYRSAAAITADRTKIVQRPCWVLEGGPSILTSDVLARAEHVVWLDMPKSLRLGRILWRSVRYMGRTRPEHPNGNADWPGRRQLSFMIKAWQRDASMRQRVEDQLRKYGGHVHRLTTALAVREVVGQT